MPSAPTPLLTSVHPGHGQLLEGFSTEGKESVPLRASGDGRGIFGCHTGGKGATGIQYLEARDADGHPTMHRTAPPQNYLLLGISSGRYEEPWLNSHLSSRIPS